MKTTLESVNEILRRLGKSPVSSLHAGPLATRAQRALEDENRALQREGWHFNTKYNVTLSPVADESGGSQQTDVQELTYSKNLDIIASKMIGEKCSILFLGDSINNPTQQGYMRNGYQKNWRPKYWRGLGPGMSSGNPIDNGWNAIASSGSNISGFTAGNGPDPNYPGLDKVFVGKQSQGNGGQFLNQLDAVGGNTGVTTAFELMALGPATDWAPLMWHGTEQEPASGIASTFYASEGYTMRTLWYAKNATTLYADYRSVNFLNQQQEVINLEAGWNIVNKPIGAGSWSVAQYAPSKFYSQMTTSDSVQLIAFNVFSSYLDGLSMAYMGGGGWGTRNHRYDDDTAPTIPGSGNRRCWYLDETAEKVMELMETDIVAIQTGANDPAITDHTDHLVPLIERFRAIRPTLKFLIISQYYISDSDRWTLQADFQRNLAGSPGFEDVAFLDLYNLVRDNVTGYQQFSDTYLADGLHPSDVGSEFMAGLQWQEILESANDVAIEPEVNPDLNKYDVTSLEPTEIFHIDTYAEDSSKNLVRQGKFMYDLDNNTDTFTSDIKVSYSYELPFESIPEAFQDWAIAKAALGLAPQFGVEGPDLQILTVNLQRAETNARRDEMRRSDVNVLETREAVAIRGRRRMGWRSLY